MSDGENDVKATRQERRAEKMRRRRERISQHGRSLVRIYKDSILKRRKKGTK
jgi:hypothetical protein